MTKQLQEVVLPDSGATVRIKFVGPLLLNDIMKASEKETRKALAKPEVPMVEVAYEKGPRLEANPNNPAYLSAVQEWENAKGIIFAEKLFHYGADVELSPEALEQVKALRADMGADAELPANDKALYITRILIQTNADFTTLQNAILGRAQPTEVEVAKATEAFPAALQGA